MRIRYWQGLRPDVLLVRGARENARGAMLEAQLQMSRRRQATVALTDAGSDDFHSSARTAEGEALLGGCFAAEDAWL